MLPGHGPTYSIHTGTQATATQPEDIIYHDTTIDIAVRTQPKLPRKPTPRAHRRIKLRSASIIVMAATHRPRCTPTIREPRRSHPHPRTYPTRHEVSGVPCPNDAPADTHVQSVSWRGAQCHAQ